MGISIHILFLEFELNLRSAMPAILHVQIFEHAVVVFHHCIVTEVEMTTFETSKPISVRCFC